MTDRAGLGSAADGAYSLREYGAMFAAPVRSRALVAALEATVGPGTRVAELGAGPGLYALLACRLGAERVYAIEVSPVLELAPLLAADNGMADRLVCIRDLSTRITLPERVDVLLADLRGVLPFFHGSVRSIIDARERFLKPGGVIMPRRDTLWAAVVHAPAPYEGIVGPWTSAARGLELRRGLEVALNNWVGVSAEPGQLLSPPASWGTIDYATVTEPRLSGTATCTVARAGTAHGMCAWFDTEIHSGIAFSNAPGAPSTLYGQAFFPWLEPVAVDAGDVVHVRFQVLPGRPDSIWTWDTSVATAAGELRASFRQSTFFGYVFPADDVRRRGDSHVPALSVSGRVARDVLAQIDGARSLGEIAAEIRERYPDRFPDWIAALERVADVSNAHESPDAEGA